MEFRTNKNLNRIKLREKLKFDYVRIAMQNLVFVCFCKSFKSNQVLIKLTVTIEQAHDGILLELI